MCVDQVNVEVYNVFVVKKLNGLIDVVISSICLFQIIKKKKQEVCRKVCFLKVLQKEEIFELDNII